MRRITLLALVGCACGCSRGLELPELLPVEGRVVFAGKPLTEGSVSYRADGDGADVKYSPTGPINKDGRYKLYVHGRAGCPAGKYRVVVFANEPTGSGRGGNTGLPRSIIPGRYNDPATTPLRVKVHKGAGAEDYDLRIEQ